jgi:hypothetical protein
LGVDWNNIANMLYDAFGPQLVSTIYGSNNQYRVLLELLPQYQKQEDSLKLLYLKSNTGALVPLDAVADPGYRTPDSERLPAEAADSAWLVGDLYSPRKQDSNERSEPSSAVALRLAFPSVCQRAAKSMGLARHHHPRYSSGLRSGRLCAECP